MSQVRYDEMLPHAIGHRVARFPASLTGLGGLDRHGGRQTIGLHALKAEKRCELAAERSGGPASPTLWYREPCVIHSGDGENGRGGRARGEQRQQGVLAGGGFGTPVRRPRD